MQLFQEIESLEEEIKDFPNGQFDYKEEEIQIEDIKTEEQGIQQDQIIPEFTVIEEVEQKKKKFSIFNLNKKNRDHPNIDSRKYKFWRHGKKDDLVSFEEIKPDFNIKPAKTTFTLTVDKDGKLVVYNIKKLKEKTEKKKFSLAFLKRGKKDESTSKDKEECKGVSTKISIDT